MATKGKGKAESTEELILAHGSVILSAKLSLADGGKVPSTTSTDELENTPKPWVPWGTNDDFPNTLKSEAESDTVILPGIRLVSRLTFGGGLSYGKIQINDGKRDWLYVRDMKIEKWLRENNISRQLLTIFWDIAHYGNSFPMFTLSLDGKLIPRMSTQFSRALYTRLSPINSYGEHEKAFINADFGNKSFKEENNKTLPCAPSFGSAQWVKEEMKPGKSFIFPIKGIDAGRQNYSVPDWNAAREMQWVKIGKDIAKLNLAYLNNAMRPMWHVEVHPAFWEARYGKETWAGLKPEEKTAKVDEFHKDLHSKLSGVDNASSYISTPLAHVPGFTEKAFSLVTITSLENKVEKGRDGWYLNTSREAGQHKVVALGLDSAMMGTIPGDGGMGAGSGSNNRVAFNQRVMLSKGDQDMYLNFMYMVAEVNGWDEELDFVIDQGLITTLDAGAEATATAAPAMDKGGVNG